MRSAPPERRWRGGRLGLSGRLEDWFRGRLKDFVSWVWGLNDIIHSDIRGVIGYTRTFTDMGDWGKRKGKERSRGMGWKEGKG